MRTKTRSVYRVFITMNGVNYYANRSSSPLPRVAWFPYAQEYPDNFSMAEAREIAEFYCEQKPTVDKLQVDVDED